MMCRHVGKKFVTDQPPPLKKGVADLLQQNNMLLAQQ